MFWEIWCCDIDHALLDISSWAGCAKCLNYFLKQPSCPRNIDTEHWRKLPNLKAFLQIYSYLKCRNNDSVKLVLKVLLNVYQCSVSSNITTLNIYFGQRSQLESNFLWFLSTRVKISQIRQVNSSSNFASFFIAMTNNFSVKFKLIFFVLWKNRKDPIKGSHQSPNFKTFKCSGESLPYSLCHFPNHKSVFLQILHRSSVSCKVTPTYFFRSNIKYFA